MAGSYHNPEAAYADGDPIRFENTIPTAMDANEIYDQSFQESSDYVTGT